jgi:hypothetical protein
MRGRRLRRTPTHKNAALERAPPRRQITCTRTLESITTSQHDRKEYTLVVNVCNSPRRLVSPRRPTDPNLRALATLSVTASPAALSMLPSSGRKAPPLGRGAKFPGLCCVALPKVGDTCSCKKLTVEGSASVYLVVLPFTVTSRRTPSACRPAVR